MEFLCWLDYANSLAKECTVPEIVKQLAEYIRIDLFEMSIEPMVSVLDINIAGFMLVLTARIIKQIDAKEFCDGNYDDQFDHKLKLASYTLYHINSFQNWLHG